MIPVSIVIPTFNSAAFVGETINSVLNQSFGDFELIIVDDGSSDNTLNVCRQFDDPRISIIEHKNNQGCSAARNTGLRCASGKYIYFLDSDDLMTPKMLAILYKNAEKFNVDAIRTANFYKRQELSPGVFSEITPAKFSHIRPYGIAPEDLNQRLNALVIGRRGYAMASLFFYRRDFFIKNSLELPNMIFEDEAFSVAVFALAERVLVLPSRLLVYTARHGSILHSKHTFDIIRQNDPVKIGVEFFRNIFELIPVEKLSQKTRRHCVVAFRKRVHDMVVMMSHFQESQEAQNE